MKIRHRYIINLGLQGWYKEEDVNYTPRYSTCVYRCGLVKICYYFLRFEKCLRIRLPLKYEGTRHFRFTKIKKMIPIISHRIEAEDYEYN